MRRWNEMSIEELVAERRELCIEYNCWMDRNDCDFDILEEIEMEIYAVEKILKRKMKEQN